MQKRSLPAFSTMGLAAVFCISTASAAPLAAKKPMEKSALKSAETKQGTQISGRVEAVTRSVDIYKAGGNGWKKAASRASLAPDDKIRTGKRSVARVKLEDGTKVLLLQNSQAEIENLSNVQKTIKLLRGRIRAIVAKIKGGNQFKINTPVGVASVRGTDFEVEFFDDKGNGGQMEVSVNEGQVAVGREKLGEIEHEVLLNAGEKIRFGIEGEIGDPVRSGAAPMERDEFRAEMVNQQKKDSIIAMAAEESRNADYQIGKSLIDAYGNRVRVEEYIMRPAADQFKLVVLNERLEHFDYFTYKGTFNTALPEDLSIALKDVGGKLNSQPNYYMTEYATEASNTIDSITDRAQGGHLVQIDLSSDGETYTLTTTNPDASTYTRTISAAEELSDGTFKIYNPIKDAFSVVSAANKEDAMKIAVLDSETGAYRNLGADDTFWKTRFNTYDSFINSTAKTAWAPNSGVQNTLANDLDATFSNAPVVTVSEFPLGSAQLQNRLSLYYQDGSQTVYTNSIIDDQGNIAPASAFAGKSTSASYKEELEKWNYEQRVTSTEMGGRYIDLVVDPRIGTVSGLIQ